MFAYIFQYIKKGHQTLSEEDINKAIRFPKYLFNLGLKLQTKYVDNKK